MTNQEYLSSMGYRKCAPNKWLKPVGFSLFSFEEDRNEWTCWFLGANHTAQRWGAQKFSKELDFLNWLKYTEAWYSKINICTDSQFQLKPDPEITFGL